MRHWLIRMIRRIVSTPKIYGLLRSGMLYFQRVMRRPDEPDLWFFSKLPAAENELILDVGANGGQSAVALSFIRPNAKILSFEPIQTLWPELERVKNTLGARFEFRKYGLGENTGSFSLFVPVSGRLPITTRASLSRENAEEQCRELQAEIGLPTRVEEIEVNIRRGDEDALLPTGIKIDVEGVEFSVLAGLTNTIEMARPVILLERSSSYAACVKFFAPLDYAILTDDGAGPNEQRLEGLSPRNWIAAPTDKVKFLTAS